MEALGAASWWGWTAAKGSLMGCRKDDPALTANELPPLIHRAL